MCDSLSVWTAGFGTGPGTGRCWLQFRHFLPHYDPAVAVPEHSPLGADLLGDSGSLLQYPINRYCTAVERPTMFEPTGRAPWHSGLSLTLDDDACETSMSVWDIQAEFFVSLEHAQAALLKKPLEFEIGPPENH